MCCYHLRGSVCEDHHNLVVCFTYIIHLRSVEQHNNNYQLQANQSNVVCDFPSTVNIKLHKCYVMLPQKWPAAQWLSWFSSCNCPSVVTKEWKNKLPLRTQRYAVAIERLPPWRRIGGIKKSTVCSHHCTNVMSQYCHPAKQSETARTQSRGALTRVDAWSPLLSPCGSSDGVELRCFIKSCISVSGGVVSRGWSWDDHTQGLLGMSAGYNFMV